MFIDTDTIDHVPSNYIVIDIETTGFSPCNDSILEIAAAKFHNSFEVERFCQLVKSDCELSEAACKVNGITYEMLSGASDVEQVLRDFIEFVGIYTIIAHNAAFDISFLKRKCRPFIWFWIIQL